MDLPFFNRGKDRSTPAEPPTDLDPCQTTPSVRHGSSSSRPGKFTKLSEFARPENQEPSNLNTNQSVNHNPITLDRISVSHIIHIEDRDPNSRIHDRIMLVIRTNPPSSVTCLSFCRHERVIDDEHCLDHAKLTTETDSQSKIASTSSSSTTLDAESDYFKLCVSLEYGGCKRRPMENAYINLKELWNIEYAEDVKFAILGKAVPSHWPDAREKIIQIFSSTVGDLDRRQSRTSEASAAADFGTDNNERMEKEKEKGKGKERDKEKGKGKLKGKETTTQQESKSQTRIKYKSKR